MIEDGLSVGRFGVWGGRDPGFWCSGLEIAGVDDYSGTLEEATALAATLRRDYPSNAYEVVPYDAEREPTPERCNQSPPTPKMREALQWLVDHPGRSLYDLCQASTYSLRQVTGATVEGLLNRGLVTFGVVPRQRGQRVTRLGRLVLALGPGSRRSTSVTCTHSECRSARAEELAAMGMTVEAVEVHSEDVVCRLGGRR